MDDHCCMLGIDDHFKKYLHLKKQEGNLRPGGGADNIPKDVYNQKEVVYYLNETLGEHSCVLLQRAYTENKNKCLNDPEKLSTKIDDLFDIHFRLPNIYRTC